MKHDDDILEGEVVNDAARHTSTPPPSSSSAPFASLRLPDSCLSGCLILVLIAALAVSWFGWFVFLVPLGLLVLGWVLARKKFPR